MIAHLDFETRSVVDIKVAGAHRYAEDESTDALCFAWAVGDEEPSLWVKGQPLPEKLLLLIRGGCTFAAWNAQFEILIWKYIMRGKYGWPELPADRWVDIMGDAAMSGYPLGLDNCAKAMDSKHKKDPAGTRLITKLCTPIKGTNTFRKRSDFPEDFQRLYEYCKQDVRTERALSRMLPAKVEGFELDVQRLTWEINDRGLPVDAYSVREIHKKVVAYALQLDNRMQILTDGAVQSARQRDKLLMNLDMNREAVDQYLEDRDIRRDAGLSVEKLSVKKIPGITLYTTRREELLKVVHWEDISDRDREMLQISLDMGHTSIAKYKRILAQLCSDDTVKGNLQYHGAGTGRDAARGFQPQNLPRATEKEPEKLLPWFYNLPAEDIDLVFPVLEYASRLIRPMIMAPPDHKLVRSDYSKVEARGTAWAAKEEDILEEFRQGLDPYKVMASKMFGVPIEELTSTQYQYGKLTVLACVSEGTKILTDKGLVPVEKICCCMRVWDGVEFVEHQGAVYRGIKEVIEYDELLGTPDHKVFTEEKGKIELQEAARCGARIRTTGIGRVAIRVGESDRSSYRGGKRVSKNISGMPRVFQTKVDKLEQFTGRENERLSKMQPAKDGTEVVAKTMYGGKTPVRKSENREIQQVWGERDTVQIQKCGIHGDMGARKPRIAQGYGDRPDRQQRGLRTGESAMGYTEDKCIQQRRIKGIEVPSISDEQPRCSLCGLHLKEYDKSRNDGRRDNHSMGKTELQTKRKVWDILNCGPRNRFTANGKLVSNCGYQGAFKALVKFAESYGITDLTNKKAAEYVRKFRAARPKLAAAWKNFNTAAMRAMHEPATPCQVEGCQHALFEFWKGTLTLELPSGRKLYYPEAEIKRAQVEYETEDGEIKRFETNSVTSLWTNSVTHKWERRQMSGGNFFQNYVQAICRDLLIEACPRLDAAGYEVRVRVHDEIIAVTPDDVRYSIDEMNKIMCEVPEWADGFPIDADGYEAKRYRK